MKFSKLDMTTPITKGYRIHGSALPTDVDPRPQVFVATIYLIILMNHVFARAKFFKILEKKHKIKASKGLIIKSEEVIENVSGEIQNYGVRFVYRSKKGNHNSYKECRALSKCGAVDAILREVAGRHRLNRTDVDIMSVDVLSPEELKRAKTMEFADENIEFPIFTKVVNTKKQIIPVGYNLSD